MIHNVAQKHLHSLYQLIDWFVSCAQLVVGIVWSLVMWGTGMRKTPNLTAEDIAKCVPIGLMACISHAGSVLAVSVEYHII